MDRYDLYLCVHRTQSARRLEERNLSEGEEGIDRDLLSVLQEDRQDDLQRAEVAQETVVGSTVRNLPQEGAADGFVAAQGFDGGDRLGEEVVQRCGAVAAGGLLDADQLVVRAEDVADFQSATVELVRDDVLLVEEEVALLACRLLVVPVLIV